MVLKFEDTIPCLACDTGKRGCERPETDKYEAFLTRLRDSNIHDGKFGLEMAEITKSIGKTVNCISCRSAAERLIRQIAQSTTDQSLALDPVLVDRSGFVSLKPSLLKQDALYTLLYTDRCLGFDFLYEMSNLILLFRVFLNKNP